MATSDSIVFAEYTISISISRQCYDNASADHLDEISDGCDDFINLIENIKEQFIAEHFKALDKVTIETGTR